MSYYLRLYFSKPDIEFPGGSEKKTGQTVDFPNTILCYDETKNKAQRHTTTRYRTSTSHKRSIVSDNIVLRRVDDTVW